MIIRPAEIADAERLLEIYGYYVENTAISFEYESPSIEAFRSRMERITMRYPWLVAEQDGRIEGYAYANTLKDREAYARSCEVTIYLDHCARKRGLGRMLYEALEAALKRQGILNLYACIGYPETPDEYLTANSAEFHAHLGYVRAGEFHRCGYKFGRWYNVLWMEKIIGEPKAQSDDLILQQGGNHADIGTSNRIERLTGD